MSHNKIKVNNESSDSFGDVPINMNTYITETSPEASNIIKYDGVNWINSITPNQTNDISGGLGLWFRNDSNLSSSGSYSLNHYYMIIKNTSYARQYVATGYSFNNATTTNTPKNNSNYMESIDLPGAGTYLCICTMALQDNSFKIRWESNAGPFSAYCDIDSSGNTTGSILLGVLTTTEADIIRVVIKEMPTAVSLIRTPAARGLSVHVIKLK